MEEDEECILDSLAEGNITAEFLVEYVEGLVDADTLPQHAAMERLIKGRIREFCAKFPNEKWALLGVFFYFFHRDSVFIELITNTLQGENRKYFVDIWLPYLEKQTTLLQCPVDTRPLKEGEELHTVSAPLQPEFSPARNQWQNLHLYSEQLYTAWVFQDETPPLIRQTDKPIVAPRLFSLHTTVKK